MLTRVKSNMTELSLHKLEKRNLVNKMNLYIFIRFFLVDILYIFVHSTKKKKKFGRSMQFFSEAFTVTGKIQN